MSFLIRLSNKHGILFLFFFFFDQGFDVFSHFEAFANGTKTALPPRLSVEKPIHSRRFEDRNRFIREDLKVEAASFAKI